MDATLTKATQIRQARDQIKAQESIQEHIEGVRNLTRLAIEDVTNADDRAQAEQLRDFQAQLLEQLALLVEALSTAETPVVNVEAPVVNLPAIDAPQIQVDVPAPQVSVEAPQVTMPEIKIPRLTVMDETPKPKRAKIHHSDGSQSWIEMEY